MKLRYILPSIFLILCAMACEAQNITLPTPQITNGKTLSYCLQNRKSDREFSKAKLSNQQISNVLWAAYGYNRTNKRTAPSAMNCQEFLLYVFLPEGVYVWNDKTNVLTLIKKGDMRASAGKQDYVADASMNIVYVADYSKMSSIDASGRDNMAYADCGFIAQNVYLYCASENMGCVIRGYVDKEMLGKLLQLNANQKVILAQSIGFSK